MKKITLFLALILISISSFAQTDYKARAEKNMEFLIRDNILLEQIEMNDVGIKIFKNSSDKANNKPTVEVKWDNVPVFLALQFSKYTKKGVPERKANGNGELQGVRIALDPGHFANNIETAILEKKFMKISKEDAGTKKDIEFFEADLAWETAYILKKRLEKHGAEVMMTRKKGKSSLGHSFKKWKKKYFKKSIASDFDSGYLSKDKYNWYLIKAKDRDIASYMNRKDILERATKINRFLPDATIIIHYNASSDRTDKKGNFPAKYSNYCMAFTGGGFMKGELGTKDKMEDFLRLLLSNDLEKSVALSGSIMKYHQSITKVPIIRNNNNVRYLQKNSVYADMPGVYCRNLGLTRRVQGALCFGESLMQDNINEAVILNMNNYKESRVKTSSRVKLVVDAFEAGILEYFGRKTLN